MNNNPHSPGIAEEIRELLESKQELVSGGPHRNAIRLLLDIKEHLEQENERITKENETLRIAKEYEIELHAQSCLDYQSQLQQLREELEQVKKERDERIKVVDHGYVRHEIKEADTSEK